MEKEVEVKKIVRSGDQHQILERKILLISRIDRMNFEKDLWAKDCFINVSKSGSKLRIIIKGKIRFHLKYLN